MIRANRRIRSSAGGFTLVEVQIAIVLFVLVMMILLGHGSAFYDLVGWLENERSVHGVVDVDSGRAFVAVSQAGEGAGPPPCEIRLLSIDDSGTYPVAEVQVRQRTP